MVYELGLFLLYMEIFCLNVYNYIKRVGGENLNSEIIMYQTEDGLTKIETTFDNETVWLSIDQMAEISLPFLVTLKIYLMKVN